MKEHNIKPLIVIVGPTASGKTALSLDIAREFGGEIICADSRTIYRGVSIGAAKPTAAEQAVAPHHLLDIADPDETVTVVEFKRLAEAAIADIQARGKVPIMVGGSGLYIDAVVFDYQFPQPAEAKQREELELLSTEELVQKLAKVNPEAVETVDLHNRRRVVRAIETAGVGRNRRNEPLPGTLMLGIRMNKEVIQQRIQDRIEIMLQEGFLDEVRSLGERFGWNSEGMSGIGYRAFKDVVLGTKSVEVGKQEFARGDYLLAKRQMTWFKRNPYIHWLDRPAVQGPALVREFLSTL